jgi:hypothetical protein
MDKHIILFNSQKSNTKFYVSMVLKTILKEKRLKIEKINLLQLLMLLTIRNTVQDISQGIITAISKQGKAFNPLQ